MTRITRRSVHASRTSTYMYQSHHSDVIKDVVHPSPSDGRPQIPNIVHILSKVVMAIVKKDKGPVAEAHPDIPVTMTVATSLPVFVSTGSEG